MADHWIDGFNFNVEEWDDNDHYVTLAICRLHGQADAVFELELARNARRKLMIRSRARVVRKHPEIGW